MTPTLPGRYSPKIADLQPADQRRHRSSYRRSPLHPANDQPVWHGSGTTLGSLLPTARWGIPFAACV